MTKTDKTPPPRGLVRALLLSAAAAALPITGTFLFPDALADYEALMWLLLLVPAFLWAYERGWGGVATALASGMALLSTTYALAEYTGRTIPDLLYAVVVAYVGITLAIGVFGERVARAKFEGAANAHTLQDALTGLANRLHADMHLATEFAAAAAQRRAVTVVMLRIDQLAAYNGRHGRASGDEALQRIAAVLAQHTRRMNLSARYGPDTFLSVLGGTPEEGALIFAGRLQEQLRLLEHEPRLPTVSIGIAAYRTTMTSPDELVKAAAEALAEAQQEGRDRVRIFGRARLELGQLQTADQPLTGEAREADRAARQALADSEAKNRAERARHAEAMTRLAGSMAHSFNNILSVIQGNSELLLERTDVDSALRGDLLEIEQAVSRAGTLTRQLLAFAGRAVMCPEVLDVNAVVESSEPLLRRALGDDIDVTLDLSSADARVNVDRTLLERVLLNLAANAREAMPDGGRLTITTAPRTLSTRDEQGGDVAPGAYIEVRVRDACIGMDRGTAARAFEPFFTTRADQEATGLGLAIVHGFVKQSGGHVRLQSEPGKGTETVILLPAITSAVVAARRSASAM